MIASFKPDFFWMLRESKGYFPWVQHSPHRLERHLFGEHPFPCHRCHGPVTPRPLVKMITEQTVCENRLFDLFFKAMIRAEVRFISRYVPQQSHEERLTGNLVSEMDSAVFLVKEDFRETAQKMYSEDKEIDFFYYDLSRGGKIESATGADLAIMLLIDLPDFPFTVKTMILQAKKIVRGSAQLDRKQYETLVNHKREDCAYLFYDMDTHTLASPLVLPVAAYPLEQKHKAATEKDNASFSLNLDDTLHGHPLSLFLLTHLPCDDMGESFDSFDHAFQSIRELCWGRREARDPFCEFQGRLAVVSLGAAIKHTINHNEGVSLST